MLRTGWETGRNFGSTTLEETLDWPEDQSVDVALLPLVLHHVDDRVGTLQEFHRVLRPGGRLIVATHHPSADRLRLGGSYFTTEVLEETGSRGWRVRNWRQSPTASCAEFTEAGFVIESLVEPRPVEEMVDFFPEKFEKLSREPGFIAFQLLKPG